MGDQQPNPFSQGDPSPQQSGQDPATFSQKFSHAPVAARVPERIARGVFSTGVCIQDTPTEFILDFLQALARPTAVVARVVIAPPVMGAFINTLRDSLQRFAQAFGPPAPLPKPPQNKPPTIQEIYEHFKLPEEMYSGVYANSFMVTNDPAEFAVDFITGFYPTAAVSCRVYLSAQQLPRVLDTLGAAMQQHQIRYHGQQPPPQQPPPQGNS
jgi:hypothetical protein